MSLTIVSGQINYPKLNSKIPEKEYAIAKVHIWLFELNKGRKPVKWLKPNKNGTKVNFEMIKTQQDYDSGLDELEVYIKRINREFGTDFSLKEE